MITNYHKCQSGCSSQHVHNSKRSDMWEGMNDINCTGDVFAVYKTMKNNLDNVRLGIKRYLIFLTRPGKVYVGRNTRYLPMATGDEPSIGYIHTRALPLLSLTCTQPRSHTQFFYKLSSLVSQSFRLVVWHML